mmetsp:Transcript_143654/g.459260  ORF Transcript_143654/g.459260 Transcript_143654/m.459260 type:complete len:86 (-) Transcript_143654:196-453(-)
MSPSIPEPSMRSHVTTEVHKPQSHYAVFNTLCPMKIAQNDTHTDLEGAMGVNVVSNSGEVDESVEKTWHLPLKFALAGTFTEGSQ